MELPVPPMHHVKTGVSRLGKRTTTQMQTHVNIRKIRKAYLFRTRMEVYAKKATYVIKMFSQQQTTNYAIETDNSKFYLVTCQY